MSALGLKAVTGEIATGTALKTLLQLVAATNHRVKVLGFGISFKGVTAADPPILVQLVRQTGAGTMSALTLKKKLNLGAETIQTTAQHTATAEPTPVDILWAKEIHPQGGSHREWFPYGEELILIGGERLGLVVTATVTTSAIASFDLEE